VVAGFEIDLPHHFSVNVEVYYKYFAQVENINRDKIYDEHGGTNSDKPDSQKKDYIIERGDAKGVDFLLKYDYKRLYVWAVYSLGFVTRDDGTIEYVPHFDRRHNVNLVTAYKFGKKDSWEINARWNFGSPFPFTLTQGFYEQMLFNNGLHTDIIQQNGNLAVSYATHNGGRLSYYHRLDISLKREFKLSKNSTLDITASVTNAYDRKNIFYLERITDQRVYQLPVLPSFGASLTF
jgi:hypothetical protein